MTGRPGRARRARLAGSGRTAAAAVLAGAVALTGCHRGPAPPPPLRSGSLRGANILLITIDTLRRDRLGVYGGQGGLTPTLDRLAAGGLRYEHAYSHAPLTLPAHTSILTGLTPAHHGVHNNVSYRLDERVPTLATVLHGAGYRTGAFVGAFVLDARFGLNRGFDVYDDRLPADPDAVSFRFVQRRADAVLRAAGDWILGRPERPATWFCWAHLFDPHSPYDAPAPYRAGRSPYDAEVAYTDAMLGQFFDRLRQAHALDHTLVVVTADHGESLGEHGENTHGLFAYNATIAVPLLISAPGIGAGVVDAPAAHTDIMPTVLDLAGVAAPAGLDGRSLVRPPDPARAITFEALDANLTRGWAPLTGVISGGWKYIDLPLPELYDLTQDPNETTNLAGREPAKLEALARLERDQVPTDAGRGRPIDPDAAARLRALGYTGGAAPPRSKPYTEADDPKRLAPLNETFNMALEAFSDGRAGDALAGFRSVLQQRPDFLTARTSAATVLIAGGRAADAVALLRAAPPEQEGSPELLTKLGAALQGTDDLRGAAAAYERARAAGDQDPDIFNSLGVVYARMGDADRARQMFKTLLDRDPNAAGTWYNLALVELGVHHTDAGIAALRRATAANPAYGDAWKALGASLYPADRAGAIDAWTRAERLRPGDYDLLYNVGVALSESGRRQEALPYLQRFVREAPPSQYRDDLPRVRALIARLRQ
ncbi:MAG: sulfatase-like hydrolase/transferase [Betaproteobacteria bacterium]